MTKVTKAVIAAAGFGTRFLPQTKAMPKEMLPLVDKPIIQYIVEQLAEAGIEDIVLVTGYHKRSIEDHFDYISADLRNNLKQSGKTELLNKTKKISELANFIYIRQKGPYGNATPVMNARHVINDEPFIYTYADDLLMANPNHFTQLIDTYKKYSTPVLPCLKMTDPEAYSRYAFVDGDKKNSVVELKTIIEKPGKAKTPSNLASIGGYLLTPDIFKYLDKLLQNHDPDKGEFQIQPAMHDMMTDGKSLLALPIENCTYYDTGNKLEYLKTVVDFGLKDATLGPDFEKFLKQKLC